MGYGTGFNSFLLVGCQLPRIFYIPHSFLCSLIGLQFWVNFVGLDFFLLFLGFQGLLVSKFCIVLGVLH